MGHLAVQAKVKVLFVCILCGFPIPITATSPPLKDFTVMQQALKSVNQAEQVAHTQVPCTPSKRLTSGVAITTVSMLSAS